MDRTLINIMSILVGCAGLFTVLTGFNVPQLNMSFFGENPFAVKRDSIEAISKWVFTIVALVGLLLQLGAEIWGANLPARSYDSMFYCKVTVGGLVMVAVMVWGLTGVCNLVAKFQWYPKVVILQRELFERAKFVVEHDGWTPEHLQQREALIQRGEAERFKSTNMKDAEQHLRQIEELLEITPKGDLKQRVVALQVLFSS